MCTAAYQKPGVIAQSCKTASSWHKDSSPQLGVGDPLIFQGPPDTGSGRESFPQTYPKCDVMMCPRSLVSTPYEVQWMTMC